MALEQGYIFMVAQHQEIITSFWNVGESGHSTSTVLGLTFQKSNSQPQNVRHGVFIPFQPLIEWCFDCGWAVPVGNVKQLWMEQAQLYGRRHIHTQGIEKLSQTDHRV